MPKYILIYVLVLGHADLADLADFEGLKDSVKGLQF